MRILVALCLMLALCGSALALDAYDTQVHQHASRLRSDPELRLAASSAGVTTLRIYFNVGTDGKIGKVRILRSNASINLRKMVERKMRGLPRMQPPPSGKVRYYLVDLVV